MVKRGDKWEFPEIYASVQSYVDMWLKHRAGIRFNKKSYYTNLEIRFGRPWKAYEYRMQNISSVFQDMGREYIPGLKPYKNVGKNQLPLIEKAINQLLKSPNLSPNEIFELKLSGSGVLPKQEPRGNKHPKHRTVTIKQYERDADIVREALRLANGRCECCNKKAPFKRTDASHYLEVHHLRRLADNGPDVIENVIAICPNCHRELHYGNNREEIKKSLLERIERLKKF